MLWKVYNLKLLVTAIGSNYFVISCVPNKMQDVPADNCLILNGLCLRLYNYCINRQICGGTTMY